MTVGDRCHRQVSRDTVSVDVLQWDCFHRIGEVFARINKSFADNERGIGMEDEPWELSRHVCGHAKEQKTASRNRTKSRVSIHERLPSRIEGWSIRFDIKREFVASEGQCV